MNPRGILRLVAAVAAVVTAVGVCVVASSYAVFAIAEAYIGPAGAAAVVAALFAVIAVVVGALILRRAAPRPNGKAPPPPASLVDRVVGLARERPLVALGAATVAAVVVARNPAVVTALVTAFLAGGNSKPPR